MNATLASASALGSLVAALGSWWQSRHIPAASGRVKVRSHLLQFAYAWIFVFLYYAATLALLQAGLIGQPTPQNAPRVAVDIVLLYHLFALSVCYITNVYLRRAIVELEPRATITFQSRHNWLNRRDLFRRGLLWTTLWGLPLSALISTVVILCPILLNKPSGFYIGVAYLVQLIPSSTLFVRLGALYSRLTNSITYIVAPFSYAVLQLVFPLQWRYHEEYLFVLAAFKLLIAATVFWASIEIQKRHGQHSGDWKSVALLRLKLLEARSQRMLLQIGIAGVLVGFFCFLFYFLASNNSCNIWPLFAKFPRSHWLLIMAFAVFGLVISCQAVVYVLLRTSSPRVRWHEIAARELTNFISAEHQPKEPPWETIVVRPDHKSIIPADRGVTLLLIHGIYSTSLEAWGLLPAYAFRTGCVQNVSLLSYRHSLWSGFQHLENTKRELFIVIDGILAEEPTGDKEIVIFAHSLGCLLVMAYLDAVLTRQDTATMRRLRNVVFVNPPLGGSGAAGWGIPWAWPRNLRPQSAWVENIVSRFLEEFPSPGRVVGEGTGLCSTSVMATSRDAVAIGGLIGQSLPVPHRIFLGAHSISSALLDADSAIVTALLTEIERPRRSAELMYWLASSLFGARNVRFCLVFQLPLGGTLHAARVVQDSRAEFGNRLQWLEARPPWNSLKNRLKSAFVLDGGSARQFQGVWKDLIAEMKTAPELSLCSSVAWARSTGAASSFVMNRDAGVIVGH